MQTLNWLRQCPAWVLGACLSFALALPSYAVDELGLFELEGNATEEAIDDWETLCDPDGANVCQNGMGPAGNAIQFTGIVNDYNPSANDPTIYTGGSKDILPLDKLGVTSGSSPDKSEITNAYAAAYIYPDSEAAPVDQLFGGQDQLIVYFGADRLANTGDAFLGFWFFADDVSINPVTGKFIGQRTNLKDTLVLVNFPQANNAQPIVQVVQWDTSCNKAASNNPTVGQCAATNLRLKFSAVGGSALCAITGAPGLQEACAITNEEGDPANPIAAPWKYTSKDGFVQQFPFETFFEGGINLTALVGSDTCFSTFMAETRSSSSFTAQVKDLVLSDFPLCDSDTVTTVFLDSAAPAGPSAGDTVIPHEDYPYDPLPYNVIVGDYVYDKAAISGSTAIGGGLAIDPTGQVQFILYKSDNCSGTVLSNQTVAIMSDGTADGMATAYSAPVQIAETGAHSWRANYLGDGTFPASQAACEPFDTIQPQLSIRKEIISCDTDNGQFPVSVDGTNAFNDTLGDTITDGTNLTDGDSTGPIGVFPGTYTVRETPQPGYLAVYEGSITDCGSTASGAVQTVTLGGLDDLECAFLNVRQPRVTVIKQLPAGDSGAFNLLVNGTKVNNATPLTGTTLLDTLSGGNFGTPTVGETAGAGTSLGNYSTIISCDDGTTGAWAKNESTDGRSVTLGTLLPGEHVTCTVTNVPVADAKACLSTP